MTAAKARKAAAVHRNDMALVRFQARAPGGEFKTWRGATWALTSVPSPRYNNVMEAHFPPSKAGERVAAVSAAMKGKRPSWGWVVDPRDKPYDLEKWLHREGLRRVVLLKAMTFDLPTMDVAPTPPGLTVWKVARASGVGPWVKTMAAAFGDPPKEVAAIARMERALGVSPRSPRQFFAATVRGRPVATAMLFVDGPTAGLYCIAVRKAMRGRGIGRAVTEAAMVAARRRGCTLATLYATADGVKLYEAMGFEHVGAREVWVSPAAAKKRKVTA